MFLQAAQAEAAPPSDNPVVVDGKVMAQNLRYKVSPIYPKEARQNSIQGVVKLHAIIAKDGSIQNLQVEEGDPLLAKSAVEAVKQWKYEPVINNGAPVEVDTTIFVVFQLRPNK